MRGDALKRAPTGVRRRGNRAEFSPEGSEVRPYIFMGDRAAVNFMGDRGAVNQPNTGSPGRDEAQAGAGGRSVEAGHGDADEAEVDTELRTVMDQVIHDHGAKDGNARHGEHVFTAREQ